VNGSPAPGPRRTIHDVAKRAGVSPTTVSHALSGHGRVSEATRQRVSQAAGALGYRANPAALHLRKGRVGAIGLCLPDRELALPYYLDLALGAAKQALSHHLALTLIPALDDPSRIASYGVDGVMVVDPQLGDPLLVELRQLGVPVVTGERDVTPGADWAGTVETDHLGAFAELLDHVYSQGSRAVALVVPPPDEAWVADIRAAFATWCGQRSLKPHLRELPFFVGRPIIDVQEAFDDLLSEGSIVDCIISVPQEGALGAVLAAHSRGLRIPQDLLVASCVDSRGLQMSQPTITAIDIQPRLLGARLVDLLAGVIDGAPTQPANVPAHLMIRASTVRSAG
jgi:DNA-binding LacI/PurR family transcriptional regulator